MENNIKILIGKRIRTLRAKNNISQEKLALLSELDRTYINSVENGKRNISICNIYKICNGLDINCKDFFNSEEFDYDIE